MAFTPAMMCHHTVHTLYLVKIIRMTNDTIKLAWFITICVLKFWFVFRTISRSSIWISFPFILQIMGLEPISNHQYFIDFFCVVLVSKQCKTKKLTIKNYFCMNKQTIFLLFFFNSNLNAINDGHDFFYCRNIQGSKKVWSRL